MNNSNLGHFLKSFIFNYQFNKFSPQRDPFLIFLRCFPNKYELSRHTIIFICAKVWHVVPDMGYIYEVKK